MKSIAELRETLPQTGQVNWIGLRPQKNATIQSVETVQACVEKGLIGDRYSGQSGNRHVTLIQTEHLAVIGSLLGQKTIDPTLLRRNLAVSGINLLALKDKQFYVCSAILEYTGLCHPCSKMETQFGSGGYNAIRGHGGITARIIQSGTIRVNGSVSAILD